MEDLTVGQAYPIVPDIFVIPTWLRLPGFGLIRGAQPVLIDSGAGRTRGDFLSQLRQLIDPGELRWIYLTHTDPDHIGALAELLQEAPQARIVTTFFGVGRMSLHPPLPMDRVYLLNPGQELDVGDRKLLASRPLTFDSPETTALLDSRTGVLFSADSFGGLLERPARDANAIPAKDLRDGQVLWATIDAPWLHQIDPKHFDDAAARVRALNPSVVCSSHLPVGRGLLNDMIRNVSEARTAAPFVGPDQEALMAGTP